MPEPPRAASEFLDLAEFDWVQARTGLTLHAVASFDGDDGLIPLGGDGMTICGVRSRLGIPGWGSRLYAPRCKACCRILGWPQGDGSPKNDITLHPLAEARVSLWAGWTPTAKALAQHSEAEAEMQAFVAAWKAEH